MGLSLHLPARLRPSPSKAGLHPDQVRVKKTAGADAQRLETYVYPIVGPTPTADFTLDDREAAFSTARLQGWTPSRVTQWHGDGGLPASRVAEARGSSPREQKWTNDSVGAECVVGVRGGLGVVRAAGGAPGPRARIDRPALG